ncbi:MAG TPA: TorF family putative porin [Xanthobacteraceae bacterium]|nr:TorF family putative porin [Xanthobacteraceae bacterium]
MAGLATGSAMAADMATKAPPAPPAPPPSPWDVAISAALMTDYNFRGITQSAHHPSSQAGFELRYNSSPTLQWYAGISGESIDFPNNAAAEIDFYGGFRPTFDKLALDFGLWYYWYPGGNCFGVVGGGIAGCGGNPANAFVANSNVQPLGGNVAVADASFWEVYGKATYTFNDQWAAGIQEWYSPNVSNTGAWGSFTTGNITFTAPSSWFPANSGLGGYISGDVGYWDLGTSGIFYATGVAPFLTGVKYASYTTWDAGLGWTYKAFTLDLRYYDTNLTKVQCSVFTSATNASFSAGNVSAFDPNGLQSNWCGAAYIAKLSFAANLSGLK